MTGIQDIIAEHTKRVTAAVEKAQLERINALLDNELKFCTCEEPLQHLQQRIARIEGPTND